MMLRIHCPSCQTLYHIDQQQVPEGSPTFKCSRCGHVFTQKVSRHRSPEATGEEDSWTAPESTSPRRAAAGPPAPNTETADEPPATPQAPDAGAEADPAAHRADEAGARAPSAAPGPTEELSAKPFGAREREEPAAGDNLSFDFSEEAEPVEISGPGAQAEEADAENWQVGDAYDDVPPAPPVKPADLLRRRAEQASRERRKAAMAPETKVSFAPAKASAFPRRRGGSHSSSFFVGLFFLVALGFGLASLFMCGAPAASAEFLRGLPSIGRRFARPVSPETLVALKNVNAFYQRIKDGKTALLISGNAINISPSTLGRVRVAVRLATPSNQMLGDQTVYCGNTLAPAMVGQMTAHELDFYQGLAPAADFSLAPDKACPFVVIFIEPPNDARRFQITVADAEPVGGEASAALP